MEKKNTAQGIALDDRGQEQPKDKKAAQESGKSQKQQQSAMEGPAAYAPHSEDEKKAMSSTLKRRFGMGPRPKIDENPGT